MILRAYFRAQRNNHAARGGRGEACKGISYIEIVAITVAIHFVSWTLLKSTALSKPSKTQVVY